MLFLPDTNVWIRHLNLAPSMVKPRLAACPSSRITLCDVVKAELYYGAFKSVRRESNLALLEVLFQALAAFLLRLRLPIFLVNFALNWLEKARTLAHTTYKLPPLRWLITALWSPIIRTSSHGLPV